MLVRKKTDSSGGIMKNIIAGFILIFASSLFATEHPVLFGIKKLEAQCEGPLSPLLQTVLLSQNGALIGTVSNVAVIRFDNMEDALKSAGRENNCARLGKFIHTYNTEDDTIEYVTAGEFDGISCIGSCPGLFFKSVERDIWVDAASVYNILGVDEILNTKWQINGRVLFKAMHVEDPNQPRRYEEILFAKEIKEVE